MKRISFVAVAAVLGLGACGPAPETGPVPPRAFTAPLYNAQGAQVGSVTLTYVGDSTRVAVQGTSLPAGTHGTHLHTTGRCDAPDFTTAGPHLNPAMRQHGPRNPAGPHLGDMPNMTVSAGGTGQVSATILARGVPGAGPLFDADGTSLVVHASADDLVTDPSGNSGARIACAVLAAPAAQARAAGTAAPRDAR
ncbi:superoxide dismutase family protein [Longimicrobium terrae]|uniref:Cu-Zn family superoxide dismutase n=1 Tax=Longimicrobium terrae TaxID=1639882 RepID=A0A841H0A1_9BACT|nr:superoxide dismutase family protein [Longimicrobium terrae]MBB4637253.1 Cu-Zn family superoxide dismutase [Longimicrobium terrae]MBB6071485.1 Cu-Zn family superoxide dismutase [Longimicrobium terrae]NNC30092.1 superoxide dismutase family protein [Longimicrobium terrae]